MCGIVGILDLSGAMVPPDRVIAMTEAIRHRGPDHSATFVDGPIGLGYVRLSILDLSDAGNQPMEDCSGQYVIVYNGEVYNFPALRRELELDGIRFRSQTDTEVVANLFARSGVAGVQKLNGMFAFAVWSKRNSELWLFRDPIGVKPLYYRVAAQQLTFASEIKALLAADGRGLEINPTGLLNYLTFGHAVAPVTIFNRVYKLPPGHYLRVKNGSVRVAKYFDFPLPGRGVGRKRSEADWIEEGTDVLRQAVRRQMIADVPVGVFLSGGIDSSLLTALMAEHTNRLQTFTVVFPDRGTYDESKHARSVAHRFGTDHHEVTVRTDDLIAAIDSLVYHYDEPFADAAALPVYLISRLARAHVKVALSGEGGDEMFGGYRRYSAERFAHAYQKMPAVLRSLAIRAATQFGRARRVNRIARTLSIRDPAVRYAGWLQVFNRDSLAWLLAEKLREPLEDYDAAGIYRSLFQCCQGADTLGRLFYADAQSWMPDTYLEKVDKASMAVSLEVRVPLLDLEVIQFASTLPGRLRIRGLTTKYLLRRIASRFLPAEITQRPKHGLSVPTDPWFRGKLEGFVREILFDRRTMERGFFRPQGVSDLLHRHTSGRENCETQIWILLIFELWMRRFMDSRPEVQECRPAQDRENGCTDWCAESAVRRC